jgi:two-component system, sensor histidine kinase YesM
MKYFKKCKKQQVINQILLYIRNSQIQSRLMAAFIVLSFIPSLITGALSYNKSSQAIRTKINTYSTDLLAQIQQNVSRELLRLEYDSIEIMFMSDVQSALIHYDELSEWDKMNLELKLRDKLINKFSFLHDVSDVVIFTKKLDKIVAYGSTGSNVLNYQANYINELLKNCDELKGAPVWKPSNIRDEVHFIDLIVNKNDNREGVNLARSVKDMEEGEPIGYIMIRTNERYFSKIYENIDDHKQKIFIVSDTGIIASSNNPELVAGEAYQDQELMKGIQDSIEKGKNSFNYTLDQKYLAVFSKTDRAQWYVVGLIPYTYLNEESRRIGIYSIAVGLICFLLSILLSLIISRSISVPLKNMVHTMQLVKNGDLSVVIEDKSHDELSEVANRFDEMLKEIKDLLETTKIQEKEKRKAELLALQAQINPHFISNTLNSIKWMASIQGAENIEKLIYSLIQMLNASIGKNDKSITLEEELEYLKSYIVIQEFRYYDKFKVKFDIDDETLHFKLLRFLLQPILENAIIHGIEPLDGQGFILIKTFRDGEDLKITVTDNGVGFTQKRMNEVLQEPSKKNDGFCGIGISNVNDRIKMVYGDRYGVKIQSFENIYTTIEITLPIQE